MVMPPSRTRTWRVSAMRGSPARLRRSERSLLVSKSGLEFRDMATPSYTQRPTDERNALLPYRFPRNPVLLKKSRIDGRRALLSRHLFNLRRLEHCPEP